MARPTLHVFAISHYCEKGRWALDHHGIAHALSILMPGAHRKVAQRLGLKGASLPILVADDEVVQGSSSVIDWADEQGRGPSLTPPALDGEVRAIEERLDRLAGVHVRRQFYSEALVEYPQRVRTIFLQGLPFLQRLVLRLAWGKVRGLMIQRMDLGPQQRVESRDIIEGELDWLDGLLADGRSYLLGEAFTRADLAAAALLAPLAEPPEHPVYGALEIPPRFRADMTAWRERPSLRHVRTMYRDHRRPGIGPQQ